ncbi:MAG TPA: GNAT family N-acetyltransferase [Gemmataceae bacterium]|jgi:GNAT superfamily N-acetyltransferase|nr:GNAT family N-acetyltransferase [Gemmataceae bacterium]
MADWQIERLDKSHQRGEFCCGKAPLDDFLRSLVSQYEKRGLGRTYVAVKPGEKRAYGYYTLASGAVAFAALPTEVARKLPRHPVPVALLGRLAVDQAAQGQGLGAELLMDALHRCLGLSQSLGLFAVEVVAIDDEAKRFYEKYDFLPLLDAERHLYLPMKTILAELGEGASEE